MQTNITLLNSIKSHFASHFNALHSNGPNMNSYSVLKLEVKKKTEKNSKFKCDLLKKLVENFSKK